MDIDKEEEALRSGIERSALALKSRLEQPLMKNDSMDSTETGPTSDSVSACTTQPLGTYSKVPNKRGAKYTNRRNFYQGGQLSNLTKQCLYKNLFIKL